MTNLNLENFNEFINQEKVIVDLWAPWCGPCRMLGPVLEEVCEEVKLPLGKVNVDDFEEIAEKYRCSSIPLVIMFSKGKEVKRFEGFRPKASILEFLK